MAEEPSEVWEVLELSHLEQVLFKFLKIGFGVTKMYSNLLKKSQLYHSHLSPSPQSRSTRIGIRMAAKCF